MQWINPDFCDLRLGFEVYRVRLRALSLWPGRSRSPRFARKWS